MPLFASRLSLAAIFILAVLLSGNALAAAPAQVALDPEAAGVADETALFLKANLGPTDAVLVSNPVNYPLRYYFLRYGVPQSVLYDPSRADQVTRLWVVVSRLGDQTLAGQLSRFNPPAAFDPARAVAVFEHRTTTVYFLSRP